MLSVLTFNFNVHGSFDKQREQILNMAGCYEVQFQFAETFPRTSGYETKKPYFSGALEWVEVDVDKTDKIELQHLLLIGPGQVLKHWRQEWSFEDTERYRFLGDRKWVKESYNNQSYLNQWEQNVMQVDDSPRYECSAPFHYGPEGMFWECTSWNPLPRREFSTRSDYNVLNRRNRHQITRNGWVHEQDNEKIIAKDAQILKILAEEKGKNIYKKVNDSKCVVAKTWWQSRREIWSAVRLAWDAVRAQNTVLEFKKSKTPLWQELFALVEKASIESWSPEKVQSESLTQINSHLEQ